MLIARKNSNLKRINNDSRLLNCRLQRAKLAFPLVRDAFALLENSKCEYLSMLEFEDAYNIIMLSEVPNLSVVLCLILVQPAMYTNECLWD